MQTSKILLAGFILLAGLMAVLLLSGRGNDGVITGFFVAVVGVVLNLLLRKRAQHHQ